MSPQRETRSCGREQASSQGGRFAWLTPVLLRLLTSHRFAAKEAAIKAHSHRQLTFHDIIIERRGRDEERLGSGPPVARIRGEEGSKEDVSAMISISHDGDYATATCLSYDPSVVEKTGSRDKY